MGLSREHIDETLGYIGVSIDELQAHPDRYERAANCLVTYLPIDHRDGLTDEEIRQELLALVLAPAGVTLEASEPPPVKDPEPQPSSQKERERHGLEDRVGKAMAGLARNLTAPHLQQRLEEALEIGRSQPDPSSDKQEEKEEPASAKPSDGDRAPDEERSEPESAPKPPTEEHDPAHAGTAAGAPVTTLAPPQPLSAATLPIDQHTTLLVRRSISQGIGTTFKLWGKVDLDDVGTQVIKKYQAVNAVLYQGDVLEDLKKALWWSVPITVFLTPVILVSAPTGILEKILLIMLSFAGVHLFAYQSIKETVTVRDMIIGKYFKARDVRELVAREQFVAELAELTRQLIEFLKHWEGQEARRVYPRYVRVTGNDGTAMWFDVRRELERQEFREDVGLST